MDKLPYPENHGSVDNTSDWRHGRGALVNELLHTSLVGDIAGFDMDGGSNSTTVFNQLLELFRLAGAS